MAQIVCDDCKRTMVPRDLTKDSAIPVVTYNEQEQPVRINYGTLVYCPGCDKTVIVCSGFGTTKVQHINVIYQEGFQYLKVLKEEKE